MYVLASIPKLPCKMSFQLFWVGGFSNLMFFCGSLAQKSSCCFKKKHWEQRESPLPEPCIYSIYLGLLGVEKIGRFMLSDADRFPLLLAADTAKTDNTLFFLFILCLFCVSLVYICIAYWLLLYFARDDKIKPSLKVAFFRVFIHNFHSWGQCCLVLPCVGFQKKCLNNVLHGSLGMDCAPPSPPPSPPRTVVIMLNRKYQAG